MINNKIIFYNICVTLCHTCVTHVYRIPIYAYQSNQLGLSFPSIYLRMMLPVDNMKLVDETILKLVQRQIIKYEGFGSGERLKYFFVDWSFAYDDVDEWGTTWDIRSRTTKFVTHVDCGMASVLMKTAGDRVVFGCAHCKCSFFCA